jgi:hypothetical protein
VDEGTFLIAEKWGCGRIVMNEEVGNDGDDDCEETLLERCQLLSLHCLVDDDTKINIHLQPFSPATPTINPIP